MRTLSMGEAGQAGGGFSFFGITEIEAGLNTMNYVRNVTGNIGWSFAAGYATGTAIYYGYEWITGDSIGGDIYDLFHC